MRPVSRSVISALAFRRDTTKIFLFASVRLCFSCRVFASFCREKERSEALPHKHVCAISSYGNKVSTIRRFGCLQTAAFDVPGHPFENVSELMRHTPGTIRLARECPSSTTGKPRLSAERKGRGFSNVR